MQHASVFDHPASGGQEPSSPAARPRTGLAEELKPSGHVAPGSGRRFLSPSRSGRSVRATRLDAKARRGREAAVPAAAKRRCFCPGDPENLKKSNSPGSPSLSQHRTVSPPGNVHVIWSSAPFGLHSGSAGLPWRLPCDAARHRVGVHTSGDKANHRPDAGRHFGKLCRFVGFCRFGHHLLRDWAH